MTIEERKINLRGETKTAYISCDGLLWWSEDDCIQYEDCSYPNNIRERKDIEWFDGAKGYQPLLDDFYFNEEDYYTWLKPKSESAIEAINEAYGVGLTNENIGETFCLTANWESRTYPYSLQNEVMRDIKDLFDRLGYDVTFTKRV